MKNNSIVTTMLIIASCILLSACNKSMDGSVVDGSSKRFFTPTKLSINTSRDSATISWTAPLFAVSNMTYRVDIAKDTLFSTIIDSITTNATSVATADSHLLWNTAYYARVRVNQYSDIAASNYLISTHSFKLLGFQYIKQIRDFEITSTSVLLHWYVNDNTNVVTAVVFTPSGGSPISLPVAADEVIGGAKTISGLTPNKKYNIQLFAGTKSMGTATVTTSQIITFTTTLTAGVDDLAAAIAAAANGDVIGLNPGTYNLPSVTAILQKTISIRSVSNNPADTKILSRELDITGDGAGLTLAGVEVSGNYTGTTYATTFLQLFGTPTANSPTTFTNVTIDNCIIHDYTRCLIRGNAAAVANDFKIGAISINNSQVYNIDQINTSGYYMFSLERLQYNAISLTKSTFYSTGEGMINMSVALATPTTVPVINIDYCTMNNFGGNGKYLLFDANANLVNYSLTNSILANSPISGSVNVVAFRASAVGNTLNFSNNNFFNLNAASSGLALGLTGLSQAGNVSVNLGWSASTTNFSLLAQPSSSLVFSTSTNYGTVGDPRWAY